MAVYPSYPAGSPPASGHGPSACHTAHHPSVDTAVTSPATQRPSMAALTAFALAATTHATGFTPPVKITVHTACWMLNTPELVTVRLGKASASMAAFTHVLVVVLLGASVVRMIACGDWFGCWLQMYAYVPSTTIPEVAIEGGVRNAVFGQVPSRSARPIVPLLISLFVQ